MRLRKGKVVDYHGRLWRIAKWSRTDVAIRFDGRDPGEARVITTTGVLLLELDRPRRHARAAFCFAHELRPASRRLRRWAHEERVSQQKGYPYLR